MSWLALDIGGANLKSADGLGYAESRQFHLWPAPEQLADQLQALIAAAPNAKRLAVTMTGELADCYPTKAAGVREILAAVKQAAAERPTSVYLTNGSLATPREAYEAPHLAAASNWRALAEFANRFVKHWPALLIDLGSTTADIIPLEPWGPAALGLTDTDRLLSCELVYTGVERTPIHAIVRTLPWRDRECPVAAELFATTLDAYLLLGDVPEDDALFDGADGGARTLAAAHARMARMICADSDFFTVADAQAAAQEVRDAQLAMLEVAAGAVASRLNSPPQSILLSGQGEFLLRQLVSRLGWQCRVVSLTEVLGEEISRCAPAHALAVLAREMF